MLARSMTKHPAYPTARRFCSTPALSGSLALRNIAETHRDPDRVRSGGHATRCSRWAMLNPATSLRHVERTFCVDHAREADRRRAELGPERPDRHRVTPLSARMSKRPWPNCM